MKLCTHCYYEIRQGQKYLEVLIDRNEHDLKKMEYVISEKEFIHLDCITLESIDWD